MPCPSLDCEPSPPLRSGNAPATLKPLPVFPLLGTLSPITSHQSRTLLFPLISRDAGLLHAEFCTEPPPTEPHPGPLLRAGCALCSFALELEPLLSTEIVSALTPVATTSVPTDAAALVLSALIKSTQQPICTGSHSSGVDQQARLRVG
ncbi:hypothetical protein ZIOFF_061754 [Zingiber officinale]|uniref:Uncharacterized protein n=1 Tax=Zingiber officinale TaxID=94328 RepID=A0A8J5KIL7_ZINOF|nr:hypothetical protein ZIOFF_061754 [Zingiber officinale]